MPDPTLGPASPLPGSDSGLSVREAPVTPATSGSTRSSKAATDAIQVESSSTTRPLSTRTIAPQRTGMFAWFSKQFSRLINWCRGRSDQDIGERAPEPTREQRRAEAAERGAVRRAQNQPVEINLSNSDNFHRAQEALEACITKLRANIDDKGLLRLGGDRVQVNAICRQINGQDSSAPNIMENVANGDVNNAADVTKRILESAFKGSGITLDQWETASQITDPAEKVEALRALIQRLPPQKQEIVRQVFELCAEISQHSETNQMTSSNLGIVIGPRLCEVEMTDPRALQSTDILNPLAAFMIDHYAEVFTTGASAGPSVASWNSGEMPNTPRTSGTLLNPSDRERVPVEEQAQTSEPTAVLSAEDAALLQDMRIGIGSMSKEAQSQLRNMLSSQRERIDRSSDKASAILASAAEIANRLNAGGTTEEKRHGARLMLEHFDQLFPPT